LWFGAVSADPGRAFRRNRRGFLLRGLSNHGQRYHLARSAPRSAHESAGWWIPQGAMKAFLRTSCALCQETFDRHWPRAAQDAGRKTREVKEIVFIARRPELRAGSRDRLELDRTEPVGQMHGKHGNQENRRHRYAGERHKRAEKYGQAAK